MTTATSPSLHVEDLPYVDAGHRNHQLDLYLPSSDTASPAGEDKQRPLIVFIHGGGWQRGSRKSYIRGAPAFGRAMVGTGAAVALVSYRLAGPTLFALALRSTIVANVLAPIVHFQLWHAPTWFAYLGLVACLWALCMVTFKVVSWLRPGVRHPEQVEDVVAAVRWLRSNVHNYCPEVNPEWLFMAGHSAGAHLAALASLHPTYADDVRPLGVVAISGVYDLETPLTAKYKGVRNTFFRNVYGRSAAGADKGMLRDASPVEWVRKGAPPFLVMNAASDLGLHHTAHELVTRLKACSVPCQYHEIANTSHGTIATRFGTNGAEAHVRKFVLTRLARVATVLDPVDLDDDEYE